MSRSNDYTIGNLLNYTSIPKQINFTGKLDKDDDKTMFFIAENQQQTILNFSSDSLIVAVI